MQKITPFLWYEKDAIGVARYYKTIFGDDASIAGEENLDGTPSGEVQIITLTLFGQNFRLMSAGPHDLFNDAISFEVLCDGQAEVDKYWNALTADGGKESMCGWLNDKYGVRWQIVPKQLNDLMSDPDQAKAGRVMQAMLKMNKIIIADLELASKGE
jgi:predicted 3-demethylubiquinone-9 3-methyltransferase (glyoxalase superfamily)